MVALSLRQPEFKTTVLHIQHYLCLCVNSHTLYLVLMLQTGYQILSLLFCIQHVFGFLFGLANFCCFCWNLTVISLIVVITLDGVCSVCYRHGSFLHLAFDLNLVWQVMASCLIEHI